MVSVYNIGMTFVLFLDIKKTTQEPFTPVSSLFFKLFFFMGNKTSDKLMDFDIALILIVALWIYENILTMIGT